MHSVSCQCNSSKSMLLKKNNSGKFFIFWHWRGFILVIMLEFSKIQDVHNLAKFHVFCQKNNLDRQYVPKCAEFFKIIFFKQHTFATIAFAKNRMKIDEMLTEYSFHLQHYRKFNFQHLRKSTQIKIFKKFLFFVEEIEPVSYQTQKRLTVSKMIVLSIILLLAWC